MNRRLGRSDAESKPSAFTAGSNNLNDSIVTAGGSNTVMLGAGQDTVTSLGNDTIVAGSGGATIFAGVASDTVYGKSSSLTFVNGSGDGLVFTHGARA